MFVKILFAAFAAQALLASATTAANLSLTITVDGLRNDQGNVLVCVFDASKVTAAEFPDCNKGNAVRKGKLPIKSGMASATLAYKQGCTQSQLSMMRMGTASLT
jgi:uncharacterized protein (DUF2141 family)